jgi:hypothetical protein
MANFAECDTLENATAYQQRLERLGHRCHEIFETARKTWGFWWR